MPRRARLDVPGTLHHVIVRGVEKPKIVDENKIERRSSKSWGSCQSERNLPQSLSMKKIPSMMVS